MDTGEFLLGLVGSGGFAREVMPLVRSQLELSKRAGLTGSACFVETNPIKRVVNGLPVLSEEDFLAAKCDFRYFNIAVADSRVRARLAESLESRGAKPFTIRSPTAIIHDENEIGVGAIHCDYTVITSNASIGRFFHANIYSYVAHDCVVGDYVTFAPRVHCNGTVHIGDHAYIGTCAVIKQGTPDKPLTIGAGAIVGMGAVVTKDVPPGATVIGSPAKPIGR